MSPPQREETTIVHVDMDAFFAAVEQLDDPTLRNRPVAVGGQAGKRGVVSAASYEARVFGVRSAMSMAKAQRLCPDLLVRSSNFSRYQEESTAIMAIFNSCTPLVEPLSLDEAFLDLAGTEALLGSPVEVARGIKRRIWEERKLVASVGIGTSKLVAKIASDLDKPDGFRLVPAGAEEAFLAPLPVGRISGVGPKVAARLADLGIITIGDLARIDAAFLRQSFGAIGSDLGNLARGLDSRPVVPGRPAKGHSRERTFASYLTSREDLEGWLLKFADQVSWELRGDGLLGRVVQLKLRTSDFKTITRSRTLPSPTNLPGPLYRVGRELLHSLGELPPIRLLGLGLAGLTGADSPLQADLFGEEVADKESKLVAGIDAVRKKWGPNAIAPGRLLAEKDGDESLPVDG